jgi:DNA-directed RNA polymerase subunit L
MKLNILEDETKSMIIEFVDSDRAIAELIKDKLMNKADVEFAGVMKTHPEVGHPRLILKTTKNARALILKALEEIEEEVDDMAKQLPKETKSKKG